MRALRRNIIALNQPVLRSVIPSYLHQIEKAVRRQDRVIINHRVAALLASYFDIIFALNRVLHPGEKRLVDFVCRQCPQLPIGMAADVHASLSCAAAGDQRLVAQSNTLLDRLDHTLEQAGFGPRLGVIV